VVVEEEGGEDFQGLDGGLSLVGEFVVEEGGDGARKEQAGDDDEERGERNCGEEGEGEGAIAEDEGDEVEAGG